MLRRKVYAGQPYAAARGVARQPYTAVKECMPVSHTLWQRGVCRSAIRCGEGGCTAAIRCGKGVYAGQPYAAAKGCMPVSHMLRRGGLHGSHMLHVLLTTGHWASKWVTLPSCRRLVVDDTRMSYFLHHSCPVWGRGSLAVSKEALLRELMEVELREFIEMVLPLSNWSSRPTKPEKKNFSLIVLACGLELMLGPLPCTRLRSLPKADVFCPCAGSFVLCSSAVLA